MSIKVVMLKSGEDVIADVKEIYVDDNVVGYQIENPYIVRLWEKETILLQEETNQKGKEANQVLGYDIYFGPWAPLSVDKKFIIPADWVVTIYEPHNDVKKSYNNKMEEINERSSSSIN